MAINLQYFKLTIKTTKMRRITKSYSLLLIVFLIISNTNLFSQLKTGTQLKWSNSIKARDMYNLGFTKDYVLIKTLHDRLGMGGNLDDIAVLKQNTFSEVNRLKQFAPKYDGKKYHFHLGKVFNDKLYIISQRKDLTFIVQSYSIPSLKLENTIVIGEIDPAIEDQRNGGFFEYQIKNPKGKIQLVTSEDNKNLIIVFDNSGINKSKQLSFIVVSISEDQEMKKKTINFDINPLAFNQKDIVLTNEGVPYFLYTDNADENSKLMVLNLYTQDNYIWDDDLISINEKIITNDDNTLLISGMAYRNEEFVFYFTSFDCDEGEFEDSKFIKFDVSTMLKYYDAAYLKKVSNDISKLPLLKYSYDDIKFLENGGFVMYGEYYELYYSSTSSTSPGAYVHNTNEIWVAHFSSDYELESISMIPKWQKMAISIGSNYAWGSYISILQDDKLYFIFEDHPSNLNSNLATNHSEVKNKGNITTICTVSSNGKIKRSKWLDNKNAKIYPSKFISYDMGNGTYLIGSHLKNKFKFTILDY